MTTIFTVIAVLIVLSASWCFLTVGRLRRPDYKPFFGSLCAHRGLHRGKDVPENSLPAFRAAVEHGYGIELDVHLSSDGVPVVFHDESLLRMTDEDVNISSLTADELHEKRLYGGECCIPRFSEVLSIVNGKVPLVVELKCEPTVDPAPLCLRVSSMLDEYASVCGGEYCVESFNPFVVKWYRKNRPDVFRGQLSEAFYRHGEKTFIRFTMEQLWVNVLGRPDFVAYNHKHRDTFAFRVWKYIYRAPYAHWTIKSETELDAILSEGKNGCCIFEGFTPSFEKIR